MDLNSTHNKMYNYAMHKSMGWSDVKIGMEFRYQQNSMTKWKKYPTYNILREYFDNKKLMMDMLIVELGPGLKEYIKLQLSKTW